MGYGYLTLPGTDEYVRVDPQIVGVSSAFMVIMYVDMTEFQPTANECLIGKWSGTAADRSFMLLNLTTQQFQGQVQDSVAGQLIYNHSVAGWVDGVPRWIKWEWEASTGSSSESRLYTSTNPVWTQQSRIVWTQVGSAVPDDEGSGANDSNVQPVLVGARQGSAAIVDFADMIVHYVAVYGGTTLKVLGDYRYGDDFVGATPTRPDDVNVAIDHELHGTSPVYTVGDQVPYKPRRFGTVVDSEAGKTVTMLMREDG